MTGQTVLGPFLGRSVLNAVLSAALAWFPNNVVRNSPVVLVEL